MMNLAPHSRNKLLGTFDQFRVVKDFAEPMYNYLVHGFQPGSCFTSVLANDFLGAMTRSHPANTVEAFKSLAKWIYNTLPAEAYGNYDIVNKWLALLPAERRAILEQHKLIYTEQEETWMVLNNTPTHEPIL